MGDRRSCIAGTALRTPTNTPGRRAPDGRWAGARRAPGGRLRTGGEDALEGDDEGDGEGRRHVVVRLAATPRPKGRGGHAAGRVRPAEPESLPPGRRPGP